jgi:SAM-dependent methyltransferase
MPTIDISAKIPHLITTPLADKLTGQFGTTLTDEAIERVKSTISERGLLDYSSEWAPFNYLYFGTNFIKSYLAAKSIDFGKLSGPITIIDLGCGAGASIAGLLTSLDSPPPAVEKVICVDRSPDQLELLRSCVVPWATLENKFKNFEVVESDIFAFIDSAPIRNVVLLISYVCSELTEEHNNLLRERIRSKFNQDSTKLIIIESKGDHHGITIEGFSGDKHTIHYDNVFVDHNEVANIKLSAKPKFHEHYANSIAQTYIHAWQTHDTEIIGQIFSRNAEYRILGKRTLRGVGEIQEYWRKNAREQRDVKFEVTCTWPDPHGVTISWTASFDRIDRGERRRLTGIMRISVDSGQIMDLTESYQQDITKIS